MTYFTQKVVLLTGVASGIGFAQAAKMLENGAYVFGGDLHFNAQIKQLQKKYPAHFFFKICDVRKKHDLAILVDYALAKMTHIDILLNTAGILDAYQPSLNTSEKEWDNVMNTNLKSIFRLTNLVLPSMLQQKHGTIINMASIAGLVAGGGGAAYTAAKHAIIGYTKQLDYDYAGLGIRANCIAPGAIDTPMNAADFAGDATMAKEVARLTPAKRWAKPEEVAALTVFLASDSADYIHGVAIPIDGGWTEK
ncbi:3-oxoacyl-ACP reductase [Ligilactobacillus sp. WILCCON 0076]|uniref:3-oxoacyl-ACP reductase n=1 Tax=Ligilactobacillus ubinensis TaxID=2876789 RepID=A0A9X2FLD2_9LACO|nr:3-oxoacyl-ACP reductase [Ligilactobacillus ubinensis]MCP0887741.1 3-oxoacyl-ACP reductase [Ligilactobacillus ubinensis]